MDYDVILSPHAERDFLAFPLPLQNFVESHIHKLAADPINLSRKSVFPYPEGGQIYQFHHPNFDGYRHDFTILFRYGQDEQTLQIVGIGHIERDRPLRE